MRSGSMPAGGGCPAGSRIWAAKAAWHPARASSKRSGCTTAARCRGEVAADAAELAEELVERGKVEVAFQQGGSGAEQGVGLAQQRPYGVGHRRAVGVDLESGRLVAMAGDVDIRDPWPRERAQE